MGKLFESRFNMKTFSTLSLIGIVAGQDTVTCLNDSWEVNGSGACIPKADKFTLTCSDNGMTVVMDQSLVPDAQAVTAGSCAGTLDSSGATPQWTINTALDNCATSLSTNASGHLVFSNTIAADAFTGNSVIYISNAVMINFECSYADYYNGIEVETNVVGSDYTTDTSGTGQFNFNLQMYQDASRTTAAAADAVLSIGSTLYFTLAQANPVTGTNFAIEDCIVRDDAASKEYAVINDKCLDSFLNTVSTATYNTNNVMNGVDFSYTAFQFIENSDNSSPNSLRLVCSAYVCENGDNSYCSTGCTSSRRKRSNQIGEKAYKVSYDILLK